MSYLKSGPSNLCNCNIFKELLSYLQSSPRKLCNCKVFQKKWNIYIYIYICLNLGLKMLFYGIFGLVFWKNYSFIWNPQTQSCQFVKFCEKRMLSKVVAKNAWFRHSLGYYIYKILRYLKPAPSNLNNYKVFKKHLSYFQLAPSNLSIWQISWKNNDV